jgi:hypothetical protein
MTHAGELERLPIAGVDIDFQSWNEVFLMGD